MVITRESEELLNKMRNFIDNELLPYEKEMNIKTEEEFPVEAIQWVRNRSIELGFYGISLPIEYGGQNVSLKELCLLKEELARSGAALWGFVLGEKGGVLRIGQMLESFTKEQIEKYVHPLIKGETSCCFALTEPGAGSDARAIQTTAVKDGDEYILNGKKHFISAAPYSDFAIVICKEVVEGKFAGITAFLVDKKTDEKPGYELGETQIPISGERGTGELIFNNCRVPAENILGAPGKGFLLGIKRISQNRAIWGVTYIGVAQRALALAIDRANERKQFGQSIGEFQAIQHMLADMATEIYAARCMVYDAIERLDRGEDNRANASMVKLFTSEVAGRVLDKAVQIFGGQGLMKGHPIEQMYRTVRMFRVLTGTSEIQRNTIAKELLKTK
ncbi:acyl-CoA dehydrogenase family protein [Mesobacillus maritimus]|uniref:acyl-CoA dehydrogenase family protein n=1 Tax=Mesobacillus maritimus TaxID=1643336 RepID=UPI00384D13D0